MRPISISITWRSCSDMPLQVQYNFLLLHSVSLYGSAASSPLVSWWSFALLAPFVATDNDAMNIVIGMLDVHLFSLFLVVTCPGMEWLGCVV